MSDPHPTADGRSEPHVTTRMRHTPRRRLLTVSRVVRLTPHMVRVTLTGADLAGFYSAGFDDHAKLFFPLPGATRPVMPDPSAPPTTDTVMSPSRDYTPRRYDALAGELDIDFALHEAGPATNWALQAAPGQMLGVGGPRGSFVIPDDFDWYLFVGDETALPAIGRRLAELRPEARAIVIAEVDGAADEQQLATKAALDLRWLHRGSRPAGVFDLFADALSSLTLPEGEGYAWVACESTVAKAIRQKLLTKAGIRREWLKASGYWRRGAVAQHERLED